MRHGAVERLIEPDRRGRCRSAQADRGAHAQRVARVGGTGAFPYVCGDLVPEQVASDAGYTRGALYHRCKDKQEPTLAIIDWVLETWMREVGRLV